MKRIILLVLSLTLLLSFSACKKEKFPDAQTPSETDDTPVFADDLQASALADEVLLALNDGVTYLTASEGYLNDYFTMPEYVTDMTVIFAANGSNLNELGIFHVPAEKVGEAKALLEGYLKTALERHQGWYDSYIPEETPKLRDAEVKVFGNYVAYAIFDAKDRTTVFESIENTLTK